MIQFFTPIKGCRIVASAQHPFKKAFDRIGEVLKVDGNIVWFKNCQGDTDSMIWRFKDGNNKFVYFGA
jgi:hypothetical protein